MAYQKDHPELARIWQAKAQINNRPQRLINGKAYYAANREAMRAQQNAKYANDPQHRSKVIGNSARNRAENPGYMAGYRIEYRAANPDKVVTWREGYRARKMKADGTHTVAEWRSLLDYYRHCCAYCLRHTSEVGRLVREHMIPLSRFGRNDISNIVPSCKPCNSAKHDSTPIEFAARLSRRAPEQCR